MEKDIITPRGRNKKRLFTIIFLAVIEIALITFTILTIQNKNQAIFNANSKIADLNKKLDESHSQTEDEIKKLKAVAFYVHPESDYENFRKNAYVDVLRQTFPKSTFNVHDVALVRVFNTTSFRNADAMFSQIQNDDIVLYDAVASRKTDKVELIIFRPREQRILLKDLVSTQSIAKARSGNISVNLFGPTTNYFSDQ